MTTFGLGMRAIGVGTGALLIAAGAFAIGGTAAGAAGTTRFVATTGSDTGDCTDQANPCKTIQFAVGQAASGDTVSIAAGTYPESVLVTKSLTFTGADRKTVTVSGHDGRPGFVIERSASVTLQTLSVMNVVKAPGVRVGDAAATIEDSDIGGNGDGGVLVVAGSLTAAESTFDGNKGLGILGESSQLSVTRSSVSDNSLGGIGTSLNPDAVTSDQPNNPTLDVHRSTVAGNGDFGIGADAVDATVDISTIANNVGAGIATRLATVKIDNSTVSGTVTNPNGSSIPAGGLVVVPPQQAVRMLTGGRATPNAVAGGFVVTGSIVADNSSLPDCIGSVTDEGYNLSSDAANSCGFSSGNHSLVQADPKLGPLADNGGPTQTMMPAKHSAAIDAIPTTVAGCQKASDQRGVARPQGPKCDIGAVEADQPPIVISPDSLPHGTVGKPYATQTLSATGGLGAPYAFSLASGDMPPGLTLSSAGVIEGTPTKAGTYPITVSVDDPVLKDYTIVIDAPVPPPSSSSPPPPSSSSAPPPPASSSPAGPVANTGASVGPLTTFGVTAVVLGLLLLFGAVYAGRRRPGQHGVRYYD